MTLSLVPPSSEAGGGPPGSDDHEALQRIARAIGALHAEVRPSPDWQARVLASVRAEAAEAADGATSDEAGEAADDAMSDQPSATAGDAARARTSRWLRYAPLCAAAAVLLMIWGPWRPGAPARALVVELDATTVVTRGEMPRLGSSETPQLGSRVKISAASGAAHRALWIFRDRAELVMACDEAEVAATAAVRCLRSDDRLSAALEVALVGEYVVVALWSDAPIPLPSSSRDDSLAAARRAGATVQSQSFRVW